MARNYYDFKDLAVLSSSISGLTGGHEIWCLLTSTNSFSIL